MKRFNKYTRDYILDDIHILYNIANEKLLVLERELFEVLKNHLDEIEKLHELHPNLYATLVRYGMIVESTTDEAQEVIDNWKKKDSEPDEVKITVNPTLQCNLRCWYCYENHDGISKMSAETIDAVKKLIERKLKVPTVRKLILSFFGGEPLIYFRDSVSIIADYAVNLCKSAGKDITLCFTTNGVLLNDEICRSLVTYDVPVSLQITLDGDRDAHNATRFLPGGKPTYDTIIGNIKRAIGLGFEVSVRFNYTRKNYVGFTSVKDEFKDLNEHDKHLLSFDFHKVWQDIPDPRVEEQIEKIHESYLNNGYESNNAMPGFSPGLCYADHEHNVVVNYDGNIFRCTARDFKPELSEGSLLPDGDVKWNDRAKLRRDRKYGSTICRQCKIFPICHNGCSQDKIECECVDGCPRNYSDNYKEILVRQKVEYILKNTRYNSVTLLI